MSENDYKMNIIKEYEKTLRHVENNICKETERIVADYKELKNRYNNLLILCCVTFIMLPICIFVIYKLYQGHIDRIMIYKLMKRMKKRNIEIRKFQNDIIKLQYLLQEKWDKQISKDVAVFVPVNCDCETFLERAFKWFKSNEY
jgi:hypothetical protein